MESGLLEITESIINESAAATSLGMELEAEARKAKELEQELEEERRVTNHLRHLLEQKSKDFHQSRAETNEKLQEMSNRAEAAEAALAQSRVSSPIGINFQGPDPFSPSQPRFPAGTPGTNHRNATHTYSTGGRSSYRSTDADHRGRTLASINNEMERLRNRRPTDRPTGASETGSPAPKRSISLLIEAKVRPR